MSSPEWHHERLSASDAFLLCIEDGRSPLHVAAALLFEAGPLRSADGEIDIARIQKLVLSRLASLPRYRQRLEWAPVFEHPVWVDDSAFDVRGHVRLVCLPRPGTTEQLQALLGELVAEPLPRGRPLWDLLVIDGLAGDRCAVLAKVHHCMVDGILGAAVVAAVLQPEPHEEVEEPAAWSPRPAPPSSALLQDELRYRGHRTAELLRRGMTWLERGDEATRTDLRRVGRGLMSYLKVAVPASPTPINPDRIGSRRAFRWTSLDLPRVKAVRRRARCTVNDLILATVAGAVRRFLQGRGFDVTGLDFRVMVPVSARVGAADFYRGNRVSLMIARLPIDEPAPLERLRLVNRAMREAKQSRQAELVTFAEELADFAAARVLAHAARGLMHLRPFNMVVTNVPGPPVPLYMLGAPLREIYALVPLFVNTGLGVALFTYANRLEIGINIDPVAVPDVDGFVPAIEESFAELEEALRLRDAAPTEGGEPKRASRRPPLR